MKKMKKTIIWFDIDAEMMDGLLESLKGYEIKSFTREKEVLRIAVDRKIFDSCAAIIMEPLHFLNFEEIIINIRAKADCDAPVILFTVVPAHEFNERKLKVLGIKKILEKGEIFPSDFRKEVEEVIKGEFGKLLEAVGKGGDEIIILVEGEGGEIKFHASDNVHSEVFTAARLPCRKGEIPRMVFVKDARKQC